MARVERVLIVGGGMAGLSLAIALRQRGLSAEIVERADEHAGPGAGLYLVGLGTRALGALGLADAALREGCINRTQTFRNHGGALLAELDVDAYWASCGPCLGLQRAVLHRLLAEKTASQQTRFGIMVGALRQQEEQVSVRFTDGSADTYDLVVGADGIRSSIRRLEFGESDPRFRGQVGWRFIARRPAGVDGWTVFLGSGSAFLLLPIGGDQVYCYADRIAPRPVADPPEGRVERLREIFRHFARPVREVLAQIDSPEQLHFSAIEEVVHEPWGRGRVVLIGDAAHAMSPNMACGAALAFEDALVLAEVISQHGAVPGIVPEFMRRRSARVGWHRNLDVRVGDKRGQVSMHLDCGPCVVREWRTNDRASLLKFANNRNIWRNLTHRFPHPYTAADADSWFSLLETNPEPTHWAIVVDDSAVGGIGVVVGEGVYEKTGHFGYWLGEPY